MKRTRILQLVIWIILALINVYCALNLVEKMKEFHMSEQYYRYVLIFCNGWGISLIAFLVFLDAIKKICCDCIGKLFDCIFSITCIKGFLSFFYYCFLIIFVGSGALYGYWYFQDHTHISQITNNQYMLVMLYTQFFGPIIIFFLEILSCCEKDITPSYVYKSRLHRSSKKKLRRYNDHIKFIDSNDDINNLENGLLRTIYEDT